MANNTCFLHDLHPKFFVIPTRSLVIKIFPSIILPTASRFRRPTSSSNFGTAVDRHEVHGGLQLSQLCFIFLHESFSIFEKIAAHKQLVAENERVFHKTRLAGCTKRYGSVSKLLFIYFFFKYPLNLIFVIFRPFKTSNLGEGVIHSLFLLQNVYT